ncbi:hypothetical protein [Nocardia gamkensis]|uniref:SDR family oxidoreductase n=1 Tax=Nocardia gamkensis TaxID=352869 RepID=A0A7X6R6Z6_9NOCA|nr:hypothetical protein [Nocardia gamkensis]NKY30911.1 SDR family oxidoreductase [Nocardia gamkensis]
MISLLTETELDWTVVRPSGLYTSALVMILVGPRVDEQGIDPWPPFVGSRSRIRAASSATWLRDREPIE